MFKRRITSKSRGFTVVELLITVVMIGLLASVVIVSYNGFTDRARETQREQDMVAIEKALLVYDSRHGGVPSTATAPRYNPTTSTRGGWDPSIAPHWLALMKDDYGEMPVDPENKMGSNNDPSLSGYNHRVYFYHCYKVVDPYVRIGYHNGNSASQSVVRTIPVTSCI